MAANRALSVILQKEYVSTKRVLMTSFIVDVIDVLTNGVIAIITRSAVMFAETLQGVADLSSVGMLLIGYRRANKRPTKLHPFGFGKELYYWSTLAAFVVLTITATLTLVFGFRELAHPNHIRNLASALAILSLSLVTNGYAFWVSSRKLLEGQPYAQLVKVFAGSIKVAPKTAVVLDAVGTVAAVFGLISLALYRITGYTRFDGIGAIVIGLALVSSASILLLGSRSLVTGRSASRQLERKIRDAARDVPEVEHVLGVQTMVMGSDDVLANLNVHLKDGLNTDQVERSVDKIKNAVEASDDEEELLVHVEPDDPDTVHVKGQK
ncbi:MAG TPA: cation diffusion facilitator family transporter [Candidatus Saccharimonadales bacterium]|nr:cation diffusion facilitator family transporter [Candidatus Saccharimonadales bacterium]